MGCRSEGQLYILQTRPITATSQQKTGTIWTRNLSENGGPYQQRQLGWEEMQEQIEYLIAYPKTEFVSWWGTCNKT